MADDISIGLDALNRPLFCGVSAEGTRTVRTGGERRCAELAAGGKTGC